MTVSDNGVPWERVPPTPVIVIEALPSVAVSPAVSVSADDPEPAGMIVGENWAAIPDGVPVAESDTADEKPPTAAEFTISVALVPRGTVIAMGVTDSTKSGTGAPLTL